MAVSRWGIPKSASNGLTEAGPFLTKSMCGFTNPRSHIEALYRKPNTSKPAPGHNLRAYDTVSEARASIGRYLTFYNGRRPHSSLDRQTPNQAYFTRLPQSAAA